ncbi:SIS domain-containing protein [Oceanomicrobium pacificus]|uniref:SIS domain-containing protein n=1 Tax=Oceanomicrobium pacificus TaxID=2692916 RepID=A0A6B0TQ17_9RHOB|nr:SIS domain-containing protein [Oceanomicrobium pacificus]MXU66737.1 SIS domain-containing protein [Oceanomicrobium pacificus]
MTDTHMRREIAEIPDATARLLGEGRAAIRELAAELRATPPLFLATVARGSSDHAALFIKYACEMTLGLPVASLGPSVASVYGRNLALEGALVLSISQSGKSPDNVAMAGMARAAGARTAAITNDPASPLAEASDRTIALCAGPETSVAATKTFVTSSVAGLALLAEWSGEAALLDALDRLPEGLAEACTKDWSPLVDALEDAPSLYVLGRGPGLAMSNEAALKFKETCQIHAESYSSAEVLHGPVSIVEPGYPVLALAVRDAAEDGLVEVADALADKGARVFATSGKAQKATRLPFAAGAHPLTDPLLQITSFYGFIERLALRRGLDPDTPRNLRKVTETV